MLITFPQTCLRYRDASGKWQYRFAFDVNARDASGQTALYVACTLGNVAVVDALLSHTVPVYRVTYYCIHTYIYTYICKRLGQGNLYNITSYLLLSPPLNTKPSFALRTFIQPEVIINVK